MSPESTELQYRLLVVEDEPDLRLIIKHSLKPMEVVTAVNGLDGLMKLERVDPDFIISDVMMPEMDGWEFVTRVRQRAGYEQTPVVFLTALTSRDDMKKGYETGADVYLTKPYDPARLKKNLEVFIRQLKLVARPKRFSLADIEAADRRQAEAPRVAPRTPAQPVAEEDDPFQQAPAAAVPTPTPPPVPKPPPPPAPLAAPEPPAPPAAAESPAPPRRPAPKPKREKLPPPRLVVATGDRRLITELQDAAPAGRCEIIGAADSPSAMDKTSLYDPDALVLHWQLTGGHAPALAQLFIESPTCRAKPMIVVTDKRLGGGDKRLVQSLGAFEVLRRPVKPTTLRDLLVDINQVTHPKERVNRMAWEEVERLEAGGRTNGSGEDPLWTG